MFDLALLANADASEPLREAEWRRVFNHFNPRLQSYFANRVPDADGLADLVAEVWRRVLLNIGRLRSASALWSWMIQIGINLLRDWGRQGVRRDGRRLSLDELTAVELRELVVPRLADDPDPSELGDALREILATLPVVDRELLELYVIDELTHSEIASRLNLPSAAASRKRLQRIKSHVGQRLLAAARDSHVDERDAKEGRP